MGQSHKLNPRRIKEIGDYLAAGAHIETVAALVGIEKKTFYNWLKRGKKATRGIYREFYTLVRKSLASAETGLVLQVHGHAEKQWKAAAWMLERRFPKRWMRREGREVTGKNGGPVRGEVVYSVEFADEGGEPMVRREEKGSDARS